MFAGDRRLHAAGGGPVVQIFLLIVMVNKRRHHRFVVMDRRGSGCIDVYFAQAFEIRHAVFGSVIAGVDVRVADAQHLRRE